MLKVRTIGVSLVILAVIVGGSVVFDQRKSAASEQTAATKRQTELNQWQQKVNQWDQATTSKVQSTSMAGQGIAELPNTGPSDQ